MRLAKLKLAGFKTFVDPTTVLTPGNLVGVVGPNGCGKSNIIDAVRWVLGETRASALRGESMQDVIFNGSTTRKPVARASVELVFDNLQGKAAGQWSHYAEISVKRVLDRSGESSYFINNVHVRRKDVIDLFLGTGLGPRAYAIIEQGMISRIIEARPEEIRGFLEEAAGVTKYRERRRETEGRLADARDNLTRLDDIRTELGERIGHLEAQAEVARRYRALHARHLERQQLLWLLKRNEARAEREVCAQSLSEASRRIEVDNARLAWFEAQIEAARACHLAATEAVNVAQADWYAASAEVTRLEGERRHQHDTRHQIEARLLKIETERLSWQDRLQQLESETARWQALGENAALRVEQAEARHEEAQARLPQEEEARQRADATVAAIRREFHRSEQQLRAEEARAASARRSLETLAQRRLRLAAPPAGEPAPTPEAIARHEERLFLIEDEIAALATEGARLQADLPQAQAALKAALAAEQQAQRAHAGLRARFDALKALQEKVASQGSLAAWLAKAGLDGGVPLWQQLRIEPGWELALEAVLGERLAALSFATPPVAWPELTQAPAQRAVLLLGQVQAVDGHVAGFSGLPRLIDCLSLSGPPAVAAALTGWLAGAYRVDDLSGWLERAATLPEGVVLVNRQGQRLTRHALSYYRPDAQTHGALERQRELDGLARELDGAQAHQQAAQAALAGFEAEVAGLQEALASQRQRQQALQQQRHAEEVAHLKLVQARQRFEEREALRARDLAELAQGEATEQAHLAQAERELARCEELAALQGEQLLAAENVLARCEQSVREARALEAATARAWQEACFSERECVSKLEDLARNRELAGQQLRGLTDEAAQREEALAQLDEAVCEAALQQALALGQARETALARCRDALQDEMAALRGLEDERQRAEREAQPLREQVAELRLQLQAAELAQAQYDARLVEMAADESLLAPLLTEALREAVLQREVARLARELAELGPVNLAAVDELEAAVTRKGYLDGQAEDLDIAIGTLEDAIRRIDRETREQLQATYNTVNGHFGSLFPRLFGGGEARLVMTGEEILDAGIQIVAQPPGKKNSSIHLLSGGEKALTAIALVFSLFQLNPAPFCMLDEVDAPLDDANTERYCAMVRHMSAQTQFLFISHSKITMEIARQLVGVTMQEQGVSRVVEVDMDEALRLAETAVA